MILKLILVLLTYNFEYSNCFYNTNYSFNTKINTTNFNFEIDSSGGDYLNTDIYTDDSKLILPIPVKEGYSFIGYEISNSGSLIANEIEDINLINNKKLTSVWIKD